MSNVASVNSIVCCYNQQTQAASEGVHKTQTEVLRRMLALFVPQDTLLENVTTLHFAVHPPLGDNR